MTTGERIANLRESRDVLQKELAKVIDVDPVVLNRIEKNKRPVRGDELKAIADYFKVTTDYLLGRDVGTSSLSSRQAKLLDMFEGLNVDGQNTLMNVLGSLRLSHAKGEGSNVMQKNSGGTNFLTMGGNNSYNIVTGQ